MRRLSDMQNHRNLRRVRDMLRNGNLWQWTDLSEQPHITGISHMRGYYHM